MATPLASHVLPPPNPDPSPVIHACPASLTPSMRETFVEIWHQADPTAGLAGRAFSRHEQAHNESRLSALVDSATIEMKRARHDRTRGPAAQIRLLAAFRDFVCPALGWDRSLLEGPEADEFVRALRAFPILAREFDPELTAPEIYQAARNAITVHCLQRLLSVPVQPTPSCLAYSLLYPYTDNFLDDGSLERVAKTAFGVRLSGRLAGERVVPSTAHEARVFRLVEMIESEYARDEYPEVFQSLLAIHDAQQRSLALLHDTARPSPQEIIDITVDKGGTSVLADGYLAAGSLTAGQAECVYGLGVFLQLRDDLEDLAQDQACHQHTVFSSAPSDDWLDVPTARTFAVGAAVVDRLHHFPSAAARQVRELIRQSLCQTIADAAASCATRYSPRCLQALEARSPVRLAFLVHQRRRVSRAHGSFTSVLEAWLAHPDAMTCGADQHHRGSDCDGGGVTRATSRSNSASLRGSANAS